MEALIRTLRTSAQPWRAWHRAVRHGLQVVRPGKREGQHGLTGSLRVPVRLSAMVVWSLLVYSTWIGAWPFFAFSQERLRPVRRKLLALWGRGMLRIVNMKVEVCGTPPEPPFFLAANHVGYVDIFVMAAQLGPVFIAKAEMEDWPVFGAMMKATQQLFIRRADIRDSKRVIARVDGILNEDDGIVVFPEGRCSAGGDVLPFKSSLFQVAAVKGVAVHYAALSYRTPVDQPAASDDIAWWRWEPMEQHFQRFLSLPESTVTITYGPEPITGADRKILARDVHAAVAARFTPLRPGELEALPMPDTAPATVYGR